MCGYSRDELLRLGTWELLHPDSHTTLIEAGFASLREPQTAARLEIKILTREGEVQKWDAAITGMEFEGDTAGMLTAFEVNGNHAANANDAQVLARDPLTGMLTNAAIESVFRSEARRSERSGRSFSILVLKLVDSGHAAGAATPVETNRDLCKLASVIGQVCRLNDVPFRHSTREFAIVLPETSMAGAKYLVGRIVNRLGSEELNAAIFAGAASFPKDGSSVETVVRAASQEVACVKTARVVELTRSA
jgi:diguanylate cyclase (GGDEF)-like protein